MKILLFYKLFNIYVQKSRNYKQKFLSTFKMLNQYMYL
ncbi:hypothetical protein PFAG_01922 [Plasmodium falciparum Santa Lucia]|uniref:Uncharacterized protein n=5 Tax=Plasmodium falciparum TaxID=5833 RepID=W4IRM9_PLAFP|nr:hypothetical protein PFNF135_02088 [Plasmodium falciparum NF135/5.C10]ETW52633.1 hypothetical protein PFUGPA_05639 [Plasmodium falciparum Palo Alto/Uganda]ETW62242.1 hypothetical protein PFMC_01934 [Plasmodium falciparum CAMP/Malaysia]EUT87598.1 hypothetical protein PFAG_01922 [Plasmodium falciparum Santa Lucia]EWC77269.1 hypothetical protein C923_02072 [Plasmodium falciparum UGT5.1]